MAAISSVLHRQSELAIKRQRKSVGSTHRLQIIPGSNQIESDPRCFSAVLYEGQFVVLYFVGDQLLMPSSYHAGFTR